MSALLDEGRNRRSVTRRSVTLAGGLVVVIAGGLAALQPAARADAVEAVRAAIAPLVEKVAPGVPGKVAAPAIPKAESALTGTVRGPDGRPVGGALVIVKPSLESVQPSTVTTAADGQFRLPLPTKQAGPWDVVIEAKGLAAARIERVARGATLSVTLEKGGVITGTVRDGNDRRPVGGARVSAIVPTGLRYALPWQPSVGAIETSTDRDGRFRLEGVARGLVEVSARAPHYGTALRRNVRPGATVDLLVFPGASIFGVVRGPGDKPVAGAIVAAQRRESYGWTAAGAETTDARGAFVLAGVPPGAYLLMTRHPGLAPATTELNLEALAEAQADFSLRPGAAVVGQLVDDQGRPAVGKVLFEEIGGLPLPRQLAEGLKVETGTDGIFALERVPVGITDLGVTAPGFTPRRLQVEVGPREKPVDLGKVSLERGLTIAGRVVDRAGVPLANASLYAWPTSSATFAFNSSSPDPVLSEANGSFVIGGLEAGTYNVTASLAGYVTAGQKADAGSEKAVRLVATPAGTITGSVVDGRRRPVSTFTVMAERVEKDDQGYGASGYKAVTSSEGRFTLEDMAAGTYVVRVSAPEAAPGSVGGVKLVAGGTTDAGVIRLAAGGIVRGAVVDTSGAPIAGATLAAFVPGPGGPRDRAEGQSDTTGQFEIGGVRTGRVTVTATHPSYAAGQVTGLEVDPESGPAETRVVMSVGGRVQGSVRKRDGTPLPGLRLTAAPRRTQDESVYESGVSAVVQNDGTFSMEHLAPGPASVVLTTQPSLGVSIGVQSKDVMVVEGQTASVDFTSRELRVSGRVTRGETAMPGVRVVMRSLPYTMSVSAGNAGGVPAPQMGPRRLEGVSREDGTYELIALNPGSTWLEVASQDGRVQYATRTFELPDVESHVFDIELRGAPVRGTVVDKATGAGVPRANVRAKAKKGEESGGAAAAPDGRFSLELAPGDYKVETTADGYAAVESELTVGETGASDVRLELSRGQVIEGKVVDLAGRPVPGAQVFPTFGDSKTWLGMTLSMEDGSFRLEHLLPRPHTLASGSPATGFAIRAGVSPGEKDLVLTLRPGGRIRLLVEDATGAPVAGATPSMVSVDGSKVLLFLSPGNTDAMGTTEFVCPAGAIEISTYKGKLVGKATVRVESGATASARLVLGAPPPDP